MTVLFCRQIPKIRPYSFIMSPTIRTYLDQFSEEDGYLYHYFGHTIESAAFPFFCLPLSVNPTSKSLSNERTQKYTNSLCCKEDKSEHKQQHLQLNFVFFSTSQIAL